MTLLVSAADVRTYLDNVSATSSDQYSDGTIGSNILAAQSSLEQATGRFFVPRTFTSLIPYKVTTQTVPQVALPGFRTFTTVTWAGTEVVIDVNDSVNATVWGIPDLQQTGVYIGIQFRPYRVGPGPWWLAYPDWFDRNLDSPWYAANYWGNGSSLPNDLLIVGAAGYDPSLAPGVAGSVPFAVLHAIKVLAAFYTMRPASILADVAITPQGGILNYSQMPAEVRDFISAWQAGTQAVSV